MSNKRAIPLHLMETLQLDEKMIEIFETVYAKYEKQITNEFKTVAKKELKQLLPVGSVIKTRSLKSPDIKSDFKTENVYKGTYQRSMFTIQVPHLTKK